MNKAYSQTLFIMDGHMAGPVVTLTTDFGTRDGYVGAMIGVVLSHAPEAVVHSITHDVPPQDVAAGAWALRNAWEWFPTGSIHVIVVDPGVGTDRHALVASAEGHLFIGPDNGIIPAAVPGDIDEARSITNPDAMARTPSTTFHGRDIFSWCAGWIAAGNDWTAAGPEIARPNLVRIRRPAPSVERSEQVSVIRGRVMVADRFGNLVTTIPNDLPEREFASIPAVMVNDEPVPFGATFGDVHQGAAIAYTGSSGYIEVSVNCGNALERFGRNATVALTGPRA